MAESTKDTQKVRCMKRIWAGLALSLFALSAQAQSIGGSPFIAVHGSAKTEVVPDVFPLEITLKDTSLDAKTTQAQIEGYAQQILALTKAMKLADKDVNFSNLSVSPEYRWDDKSDKQVFLGNTYNRTIKLRFHTLGDLRKAISEMPKSKQVRLDTGSFESSQASAIRRELLEQAVEDARKTADVMASAVGKRVGGVHNVSNRGFNVRYVESDGGGSLDSFTVSGTIKTLAPPAPPVALREGSIQISQDVYIIYTLVD